MTPEELNDRPNGWPSMPARDQFLINAVGRELNDRDQRMAALEQRIEALEKKIDELEFRQGQFRYCGTWSAGQIYFEGNLSQMAAASGTQTGRPRSGLVMAALTSVCA